MVQDFTRLISFKAVAVEARQFSGIRYIGGANIDGSGVALTIFVHAWYRTPDTMVTFTSRPN